MTDPTRILVVDDDESVRVAFRTVLTDAGYEVITAPHATAALDFLDSTDGPTPDLIILDLMLPDADGLVLCAELKARVGIPIMICSATSRQRDAVLGLKLGADDFLAKPFDLYELTARVEALLRRTTQGRAAAPVSSRAARPPRAQYRVGELVLDHARRSVALAGEQLHLTPSEYRLLAALMSRLDEVFSRQQLTQLVWGFTDVAGSRLVDICVSRLRAKLEAGPAGAPSIVSLRGRGYKMTGDGASNRRHRMTPYSGGDH